MPKFSRDSRCVVFVGLRVSREAVSKEHHKRAKFGVAHSKTSPVWSCNLKFVGMVNNYGLQLSVAANIFAAQIFVGKER